jgi:D-alanyl-lipoteichoic acid acyltransferase DltB (MBOAT superfamily)
MLFNSAGFLIFFPIVALIYYLIPNRFRYIWIFLTSYFFYMCWNPKYGFLLFGVTLITYFSARAMERVAGRENSHRTKKWILGITVAVCLLILCFFKYLDFAANTFETIFEMLHIGIGVPRFSIVIPVGISFYLFQSLGYVIDVYRGKVSAEKNLILYAAYISFFPQLVAGPIERADKLLPQFPAEHRFDYQKTKNSLLLMLWGFFMKIVIADRIAIYVDAVYDNYESFGGWLLILATVLFAFQIYCDFAGYSLIAKGAAGVMGFELVNNFDSPYCASGVREFWSRWHISLTGWFRDYVYIPLGGNRKGKVRKHINTFIVFLLSGLWHGSNWSYVLWGGLNGLYIILEDLLHVKLPKAFGRVIGTIVTFLLVDISWIFFRAPDIGTSFRIIKSMLTFSNFGSFFDNTVNYYIMDNRNFVLIFICLAVLMVVDIAHYNKVSFRAMIARQKIGVRWAFYWAFTMCILIFGVWGPGFDKAAFIYFRF